MTEALQVTGCVVAAAAVSIAMLGPGRRLRAAALLGALAIALALLLGEGWDELASIRDRPAVLAALLAAATAPAPARPAVAAGRGAAVPHPDRRQR